MSQRGIREAREMEDLKRVRAEREKIIGTHGLSPYMQEALCAIYREVRKGHELVAVPEWAQRTTIDALSRRSFVKTDVEQKMCCLTEQGKEVCHILCQDYREELVPEQLERRDAIFELADAIEHTEFSLARLQRMLRKSLYRLLFEEELILKVDTPVLGPHRCESNGNPLGLCVYLENSDPAYDDCIFCHEPEERK